MLLLITTFNIWNFYLANLSALNKHETFDFSDLCSNLAILIINCKCGIAFKMKAMFLVIYPLLYVVFVMWDNELMNIAAQLGADSPTGGNIIKMLCAQLKTLWISEGAVVFHVRQCTKHFL